MWRRRTWVGQDRLAEGRRWQAPAVPASVGAEREHLGAGAPLNSSPPLWTARVRKRELESTPEQTVLG